MFLRTIIEEILRNGRPKQAAGLLGIPAPDKKNNHAGHLETCLTGTELLQRAALENSHCGGT